VPTYTRVVTAAGNTAFQCDSCPALTTSEQFARVHVCNSLTELGRTIPDSEADIILLRAEEQVAAGLELFRLVGRYHATRDILDSLKAREHLRREDARRTFQGQRAAGEAVGRYSELGDVVTLLRTTLLVIEEELGEKGWRP